MYGTVFVTQEECTYSYFDKCILYFRVLTLSKASCIILGILQLVHYFRFLYTVILHAVNYVLCVYYPVFGLVCCFLSSGCYTTPLIHCCSSIKITPKAVPLYLSTGVLPEGILIQSIVGGAQPAQSVILTRTWAQCTNRTPMNNCCHPLR